MGPPFARGRGRGRGSDRSRGARGGGRGRGRGRGRGGGEEFTQKRSHFNTSRLEEERDDTNPEIDPYPNGNSRAAEAHSDFSDEPSDNDEVDVHSTNHYASLLQTLRTEDQSSAPARKKRKLSTRITDSLDIGQDDNLVKVETPVDAANGSKTPSRNPAEYLESDNESNDMIPEDDSQEAPDEDNEEQQAEGTFEPFEKHFAYAEPDSIASHLATPAERRWMSHPLELLKSIRASMTLSTAGGPEPLDRVRPLRAMRFKKRLSASANRISNQLNEVQHDLAVPIFQYLDVVSGTRGIQDPKKLRDVVALHALDHVFKTRDQVIKNNTKLSQHDGADALDLRDQGFTRPKVLFLLPTRQSCVKLIECIVSICEPEQQENKARFLETFGGEDDKTWDDKPGDFQDLFGGNDDDMFRIGLKFTRKTVKYFSAFYSSDIIIASPLGLRNAIENSSDGKEKKKGHDADFLSSIEIVVVDHANALQMQNWEHVDYIFSQLNLLPKEAHGCDFSRVRTWYLDKHARHLRQTIVLSDYITPEINALSSAHMLNIAGKIKSVPYYKGAMLELPPSLPGNITQTFSRFDCTTPAKDPEARFQHFTSTILPSLLRDRQSKGTLIFIPSSFDFIRLRNHFATSDQTTSLSFGAISEYTSVRDVMRARSHFVSGRHGVLLYSERAHHFRRYALKGVTRVVFYGVPENPLFWGEVVGFLGLTDVVGEDGTSGQRKGGVRAIFSKWDVLKLERVVGTDRVKRLIADRGGDVFEFV